MVKELLPARGIIVSHETGRQWTRKFGQQRGRPRIKSGHGEQRRD
jgi:transposase-like protein